MCANWTERLGCELRQAWDCAFLVYDHPGGQDSKAPFPPLPQHRAVQSDTATLTLKDLPKSLPTMSPAQKAQKLCCSTRLQLWGIHTEGTHLERGGIGLLAAA
jgi:hypothetical protein